MAFPKKQCFYTLFFRIFKNKSLFLFYQEASLRSNDTSEKISLLKLRKKHFTFGFLTEENQGPLDFWLKVFSLWKSLIDSEILKYGCSGPHRIPVEVINSLAFSVCSDKWITIEFMSS